MEYTTTGVSRLIFGLLAQAGDNRFIVHSVADDAATVRMTNGQSFTLTVSSGYVKAPQSVASNDAPLPATTARKG